jgi:hypothetical protein
MQRQKSSDITTIYSEDTTPGKSKAHCIKINSKTLPSSLDDMGVMDGFFASGYGQFSYGRHLMAAYKSRQKPSSNHIQDNLLQSSDNHMPKATSGPWPLREGPAVAKPSVTAKHPWP